MFTSRDDAVKWLQEFGRAASVDAVDWSVFGPTMGALCDRWKDRPEEFVDYLAAIAMPAGGWALYGAQTTAWEVLSDPPHTEQYLELFRAAMTFALSEGIDLRMGEIALMKTLEGFDWKADQRPQL